MGGKRISTALATTFVRETELNAVIPAALLQQPVTARLLVENVEISSGTDTSQESNPLSFAVVAELGITSISPTSAVAGSPDLTVTVTGGGFFRSTVCHCFTSSYVTWAEKGEETLLSTTFVSEKELTAIIPAALLKNVVTAQLYVRNADITEPDAYTKSNPINFSVLPRAIAR
ncbi:MAG: hypothetical protein ACM4AI_13085 [Acidobacteriota bacterium]